ncbi:ankyrin repeat domain-containing protein [Acerihabitans sp. KWT182]|uniref:Ankyrin repeat domain-containing protein n=1 Tax=Acerihabitans sp. KWT182 TaxID=3157919 RepID=A0AAU7QBI2_9GAMM
MQLKEKVEIVEIIKAIGGSIRQQVEDIFNKPGNHFEIEDMRYLSERGHNELRQFACSSSLPVNLESILGLNMANNNYIYLLEYSDAIYGGLIKLYKAENFDSLYNIKLEHHGSKNTIETFKNYSWVNRGSYLEPYRQENFASKTMIDNKSGSEISYVEEVKKSLVYNENRVSEEYADSTQFIYDFGDADTFKWVIDNVEKGLIDIYDKDIHGNNLLHGIAIHQSNNFYDKLKDVLKNKLEVELKLLINAKNNFQVTPLMQAAAKNFGSLVVDFVLKNETDIHAVDLNGKTALDIARMKGHKTIVDILEKFPKKRYFRQSKTGH